MSYSEDYRKRTIEYRQEGHTLEETKKIFKVSVAAIHAWEKQFKEKGDFKPKVPNRPFKKIDPEKLKEYVQQHPDAYLKEMAEQFHCSSEAVRKALKRLKITRKKTIHYKEQKQEKVKEYLKKIENIPLEKIAYADETGIDTCLYREYGYAPRGTAIQGAVSGRKYKRIGIAAAKLGKKITAPLEYKGTINSALFEQWFQYQLLPALPKRSIIVMDNAAFHRKKQLLHIAEENEVQAIFLPPYSPEQNPIEKFWSWLKRHLKKILSHFDTFDDALFECFKVV